MTRTRVTPDRAALWGNSVRVVREHLMLYSTVNDDEALLLEQQLPANWRKLIYRHGRARVFNCLRLGMTIGGAQHELFSRKYLR